MKYSVKNPEKRPVKLNPDGTRPSKYKQKYGVPYRASQTDPTVSAIGEAFGWLVLLVCFPLLLLEAFGSGLGPPPAGMLWDMYDRQGR